MNPDHRLQAVRSVEERRPEPCWAICTCRWETPRGDFEMVARAFDAHTTAQGVGLVPAPWRAPAA